MTKRPISKSRTAVRAIVFVLIAVDIDGFINDENPETLEANLRKWIDNIPWSRNRLETIRTCVPRELQTSFYFNIAKYHANWYQVGKWVPVQRRL